MSPKFKSRNGFSLPEMMVVVMVIGIILAIAIPYYVSHKRASCDAIAQAELNHLKAALSNLATEMTERGCTILGPDGAETFKTPGEINWTTATIGSLVGYYGWGGTSARCHVRVNFEAAVGVSDQPDYIPSRFQSSALVGRRPDGEDHPNRWVFQIPVEGGTALAVTKGDPRLWQRYVDKNQISMGCGQ